MNEKRLLLHRIEKLNDTLPRYMFTEIWTWGQISGWLLAVHVFIYALFVLIPSPPFVCEENSYSCNSYYFSITRGRSASSNPGSCSQYLVISEWIRHAPCQVRDGTAAATLLYLKKNHFFISVIFRMLLLTAKQGKVSQGVPAQHLMGRWKPGPHGLQSTVKMTVFQKPRPD